MKTSAVGRRPSLVALLGRAHPVAKAATVWRHHHASPPPPPPPFKVVRRPLVAAARVCVRPGLFARRAPRTRLHPKYASTVRLALRRAKLDNGMQINGTHTCAATHCRISRQRGGSATRQRTLRLGRGNSMMLALCLKPDGHTAKSLRPWLALCLTTR